MRSYLYTTTTGAPSEEEASFAVPCAVPVPIFHGLYSPLLHRLYQYNRRYDCSVLHRRMSKNKYRFCAAFVQDGFGISIVGSIRTLKEETPPLPSTVCRARQHLQTTVSFHRNLLLLLHCPFSPATILLAQSNLGNQMRKLSLLGFPFRNLLPFLLSVRDSFNDPGIGCFDQKSIE